MRLPSKINKEAHRLDWEHNPLNEFMIDKLNMVIDYLSEKEKDTTAKEERHCTWCGRMSCNGGVGCPAKRPAPVKQPECKRCEGKGFLFQANMATGEDERRECSCRLPKINVEALIDEYAEITVNLPGNRLFKTERMQEIIDIINHAVNN